MTTRAQREEFGGEEPDSAHDADDDRGVQDRGNVRSMFPTGRTVYHHAGHKGATPGRVVGYERPPAGHPDQTDRVKVAWEDGSGPAAYHHAMLTTDRDRLPDEVL